MPNSLFFIFSISFLNSQIFPECLLYTRQYSKYLNQKTKQTKILAIMELTF